MKKAFVLLLCAVLLTLSACDPGNYRFDYEQLLDNVLSVELIDYQNDNQRHYTSWVPNHSLSLKKFKKQNATVLQTLEKEKISGFLLVLSSVDILEKYYTHDSPKGECIRVNYENGDFLIISNVETDYGYIGFFTAEGKVKEFIGAFTWPKDYVLLRAIITGEEVPVTAAANP